MARQTINIGAAPNDGTGDALREGGDKINDNFIEVYEQYTFPFPQFTTTTSTTAYVGPASPSISAYATGQKFQVKIHATSTGAATLNINSVGAKKIYTNPTTQATTGDLVINQIYIFFYDAALDSASGGFLMVGGSAGASSIATQAEMITGTNNTKTATPLAVESKGSVKEVSVTNGATGSTDIDCGLKDTHKVLYTVTVTGNITITKSNDTNLQILNVVIPVTGSGITITFPSDVRMARYNEGVAWDQSGKVLTVTSIGTADLHELSLMRAGSVFLLRYDGPFRA